MGANIDYLCTDSGINSSALIISNGMWSQTHTTRLNIYMVLKCQSCNKEVKKWAYELKKLKNINEYCCKQCIADKTKEQRICPICNATFTAYKREKKITCSYACSNKHFRIGENNGNWKQDSYRSTCFLYHKKQCVVCGELNLVEVHHYNGDHNDNRIENLVPICPTHHKYMHSRFMSLIKDIVDKYVKEFQQAVADK